jgi:hypothetical protein
MSSRRHTPSARLDVLAQDSAGNSDYFEKLLADEFATRHADLTTFVARGAFIAGVAKSPDRTNEDLDIAPCASAHRSRSPNSCAGWHHRVRRFHRRRLRPQRRPGDVLSRAESGRWAATKIDALIVSSARMVEP